MSEKKKAKAPKSPQLGEVLRAARGTREVEAVAEKTGVPKHTIYRIENGQYSPTFANIVRLCRLYRYKVSKLAAYVDVA